MDHSCRNQCLEQWICVHQWYRYVIRLCKQSLDPGHDFKRGYGGSIHDWHFQAYLSRTTPPLRLTIQAAHWDSGEACHHFTDIIRASAPWRWVRIMIIITYKCQLPRLSFSSFLIPHPARTWLRTWISCANRLPRFISRPIAAADAARSKSCSPPGLQ